MQDRRFEGGEPHDVMAGDFAALRDETTRDLPGFATTARALPAVRRMEGVLSTMQRPWGIAALAAVAVAVALIFVPLPYTAQRGHEVALVLPAGTPAADVEEAARTLRAALDVRGGLAVEMGSAPRVRARVASGADVQPAVAAVTAALAGRGITVETQVSPWRERVSGNVYAMAACRFNDLRVVVDGRSAAEIEQDLRSQLEAAGLANPQVSVTRDGDQLGIHVQAEGQCEDGERQIRLEVQREGGGGEDFQMQMLDLESLAGLSDAEKKAEIERQMRERGIDATVTVEDGKVRVEARKEVRK